MQFLTGFLTGSLENSKELNQELIEMALAKSPTGGNAKPFIWTWSENCLHVRHDYKSAEHYLNQNNHASLIALGCLITSVEVAAGFQGWMAEVKMLDALSADITFTKSVKENRDSRMENVLNRSTYRGTFEPSTSPELLVSKEQGVQVKLAESSSLSKEFKNYILKSDMYLWLQLKALNSFFGEIRFFDSVFEKRGIRSQDLGVDKATQIMLYCFSFVPWLLSFFIRIPLLNAAFVQASKKNVKNAHFILITADDLDPASILRAGKVAMATWIDLEDQGYNVQPYSTASLTLVAGQTGHLPTDTMNRFKKLFLSVGPEVMKKTFNLNSEEKPVWLLRVGKQFSITENIELSS